ncbi:MAG: hypothetical protein M0Q21_03870 [Ignavibacteriaceae bacterium]|nr:hypothetical protein [Ignavibacteriaceae bacterium]
MPTEKEFITKTVQALNKKGIKTFPDEFMSLSTTKTISVPAKILIMGEEFFGSYEILSADRKVVFQASTYSEAKYLIYASRKKTAEITIPVNEEEIKQAVLQYEKYLDSIMKELVSLYKKTFPEGKNSLFVMNEILMILNLVRY